MARETSNNSSTPSKSDKAPAEHYINFYHTGTTTQSHYATIDDDLDAVAMCQKDPDFANRYYGNSHFDAVYRQKGKSGKAKLVRDLSAI